MRITITLILSFGLVSVLAPFLTPASQLQQQPNQTEQKSGCGTVIQPGQLEADLARTAKLGVKSIATQQVNRPYHLPLTIHIVRRTDGTGGFALDKLAVAMKDLNRIWRPAGIQFYIYGDIDYINDDTHFDLPESGQARGNLHRVNNVGNTINVYFTNLPRCGYASFSTNSTNDPPQAVLMDNSCAGVPWDPSSFAHELGHYFDLYHTHETSKGVECPNGSNCKSAGDLLCDTPADPGLGGIVDAFCAYTGSDATPENCDNTPYNPPTRNVMSYSRRTCGTELTKDQISKALSVLLSDRRNNLIDTLTHYVSLNGIDFPFFRFGIGLCSYRVPCRTISRAVTIANPGDHIFMEPGRYQSFSPNITKRVFLHRWELEGGAVHIER